MWTVNDLFVITGSIPSLLIIDSVAISSAAGCLLIGRCPGDEGKQTVSSDVSVDTPKRADDDTALSQSQR